MDKLKMESVDLTAQNIEKIGALFPNCITETADENCLLYTSQSEQQKNHYLFRIRRYGNVSLRQHRTVCAGKIRAAYSRCQRYC